MQLLQQRQKLGRMLGLVKLTYLRTETGGFFPDTTNDVHFTAAHERFLAAAIAACGGDAREAVKALIVANHFLETDLEKLGCGFDGLCARETVRGGQDAAA